MGGVRGGRGGCGTHTQHVLSERDARVCVRLAGGARLYACHVSFTITTLTVNEKPSHTHAYVCVCALTNR